jgi:hypothetical protein
MTSKWHQKLASVLPHYIRQQSECDFYSFGFLSIVGCLAALLYGFGAWLSQNRAFDPDEFYHLHVAWNIFNGWLPYRDFFDNHGPVYYFLIAPLLFFFRVGTDADSAIAAMFLVRKVAWLLSGLILFGTFWLGSLWRDSAIGLLAVFFLISTEACWSSSLEIRPDTLAVVFFLFSLILVVRAVQPNVKARSRSIGFAWSGLLLGMAFVTLQKAVYVLPGFALASFWYVCGWRIVETRQSRIGYIAWQAIGFCVPVFLTGAYFYANGALGALVHYTFSFNLGLPRISPWADFRAMAYQNPYIVIFGAAGWIYQIWVLFRGESLWPGAYLLLPIAGTLFAGLFHIPVAYYQYYLWFLPLFALFAAATIIDLVSTLILKRDQITQQQWTLFAFAVGLIVLTALIVIGYNANSHWPPELVTGYWFAAFLALILFAFLRLPSVAVSTFFLVIALPPLIRMRSDLQSTTPAPQLNEIRYIVENTAPTDTILDGFTGAGIFRPSAYFYWALPWNIGPSLSDKVKQDLLDRLRSGEIAPALILLDSNLDRFSPKIRGFVEQRYEPTGIGDIWKRT